MARDAPAAPLSNFAVSSISAYFSASPSPRPPETTTAASSSFGPTRSSTCVAVMVEVPVAPRSPAGARRRRDDRRRRAAACFGDEGLRADHENTRTLAGEARLDGLGATED